MALVSTHMCTVNIDTRAQLASPTCKDISPKYEYQVACWFSAAITCHLASHDTLHVLLLPRTGEGFKLAVLMLIRGWPRESVFGPDAVVNAQKKQQ